MIFSIKASGLNRIIVEGPVNTINDFLLWLGNRGGDDLSKPSKIVWGLIVGGLVGTFFVFAVNPGAGWQTWFATGLATAVIIGAITIPVQNFIKGMIKKINSEELLIKSGSFLGGLFTTVLLLVIFRPIMNSLSQALNWILTAIIFLMCTGFWLGMGSLKAKELFMLIFGATATPGQKTVPGKNQLKILDTSAIIDGRIADLCNTGFLEGVLIIPNFVLNELQKIADSADPLRRNRGRRGLDLLNKIQKENQVAIKIFDRDYEELTEVDTKLLRLARELEAKVVTNDFNLNKVAELYGVQVLNINELSNAIKPVVLPGEEMSVHVLRDGKEYGQGIGYLEDGTMIVVEGGKNYIGLDIEILVTSVLQTSAGRMIFAKPKDYALSRVSL